VCQGGALKYIFPSNGGLNPADTVKAKALGIDAQMAADIHVGGGGGVEVAIADFKAEGDFKISAINQVSHATPSIHSLLFRASERPRSDANARLY
jgi:hypothetical protein